jgi:hypothetical protein
MVSPGRIVGVAAVLAGIVLTAAPTVGQVLFPAELGAAGAPAAVIGDSTSEGPARSSALVQPPAAGHADGEGVASDVLLLGDSLMVQAAPFASAELTDAGLRVAVAAFGGTSPIWSMPGNIDWLNVTRTNATAHRPRTAVILFTGNYNRRVALPTDDRLCREWGTYVSRMVGILAAAGTTRVLVARSVPGPWLFNPDDVFRCESAALDGSSARLVDVGGVVGAVGSPRTRVETLPACDGGAPVQVRTADVHVTTAGAQRLGQQIAHLVKGDIPGPDESCALRPDGRVPPPLTEAE